MFTGGATIVNLWHGVGPKRFGKDISKTPTAFGHFLEKAERALVRQYYVSTSDAITERYLRVFETDKSHVLCLGQARNDVFFTPHENPLRTRFPGRRIVAYLPTFREDGNRPMPMDLDRLLDLPALEAVCQQYDLVFLVKFHQWTPGHLSAGFEHIIELKDDSLHVQMLLDAADILITDYSSCFVDHLLLDRPQILFAYDLDHYMTHERNLYGDFRADATGRLCEDNAALLDELEKLAQGKDAYAGQRQRIRDFSNMPIIMLTAKGDDMDKILGLEYGADDYITKPFNILEVKARIKAIIRRSHRQAVEEEKKKIFEKNGLRIDCDSRRVFVDEKEVRLTAKEYDLLELLSFHPNKVYSRENLLNIVWGYDYPGDVRTVDVHIRRLREKIERNPGNPDFIQTKWGVGYYFQD